jgi:hypothetical protein
MVVVQPYQLLNPSGHSQWATVQVEMSNCDSTDAGYSGLRVEHVEMIPLHESRGKH